jgi:hypothetical protein
VHRIIVLLLISLALPAASAWGARTQTLTFEAPRDLLDPATRESALAELDALGVRSLRVVMYWRSVAPAASSATRPDFDATDPRAYAWGEYDQLMRAAARRGWPVLMTVSGPVPRWATDGARDNLTRPSPREFELFMTAVGKQWGQQVGTWAIWNEPNHPQFLAPQFVGGRPASPLIYRRLFLAGWRGLRASGNGSDRLLMGETAPRGTGSVVAPIAFLRGALCLSRSYRKSRSCGNLPADGYAHHAYTTRQGPFFRPPGRDDVTIGVLRRLTSALDRAGRAGAVRRNLSLYLTEFGIQSNPPDRLLGVSLSHQAEYYALSERIAYRNPRVRAFSQYLLRDDTPVPGPPERRYSGFESGLRFHDGGAKPAYEAFRLPLAVIRGRRSVTLWGRVRPSSRGVTEVTLLRANRGATEFRAFKRIRTDGRGYWSTRSTDRAGRRWRVQWAAPGGTVFTGPPIRAFG